MNTRRQFLTQAGAASAVLSTLGATLPGQETARPAASKKTLCLGYVGLGVNGSTHVRNLLRAVPHPAWGQEQLRAPRPERVAPGCAEKGWRRVRLLLGDVPMETGRHKTNH